VDGGRKSDFDDSCGLDLVFYDNIFYRKEAFSAFIDITPNWKHGYLPT
jgi:hypothetical protein